MRDLDKAADYINNKTLRKGRNSSCVEIILASCQHYDWTLCVGLGSKLALVIGMRWSARGLVVLLGLSCDDEFGF